ncbi:MAG: putative inorganic carbon transporter subunit DabA, partial [Pseudomonadota bacterium]
WVDPAQGESAFAHWKAMAAVDYTPDAMGLTGYRAAIAALPDTAEATIAHLTGALGLPGDALELWYHRMLMTVSGWAALARNRQWEAELAGAQDDSLVALLAIRLAHDAALHQALGPVEGLEAAWESARADAPSADYAVDAILQSAAEQAFRRGLSGALTAPVEATPKGRPSLQAAFCIDVRSEVFRRALEETGPGIQTLGFAGFFGLPIAHTALGNDAAMPQLPVLLAPGLQSTDAQPGAAAANADRALERAAAKSFKGAAKPFRSGGVSCFGFVEAAGLGYLAEMGWDALGLARKAAPNPKPHFTSLDPETRIATAAAVLGAMSLTHDFAPIVLLAGHGGSCRNNPHARGLDCGACGGQNGEVNARLLAGLLNEPLVRAGLKEKGIEVPGDTRFVAALHDTTTDEVTLYDTDGLPPGVLAPLKAQLAAAGRAARAERAPDLGLADAVDPTLAIAAKAKSWAETRPEWGLADCAAFIAAPRSRTRARSLGGRAFLHDYVWQEDQGFGTLELILTAPVVVASWISLQYYGSTLDNRAFGSGNKTLHNVVGGVGVLEGNGGDLRVGLPLQSVHDGTRAMHRPLRLTVAVEAPAEEIEKVLTKHANVRELVENGWISLFQLDAESGLGAQWRPGGWAVAAPLETQAAA